MFFYILCDKTKWVIKWTKNLFEKETILNLEELEERALALGANAIVGIDVDYETMGDTNSILMVAMSGTAVVI